MNGGILIGSDRTFMGVGGAAAVTPLVLWTPDQLSAFAEYDATQGSDLTGFTTDNSGNGRDLSVRGTSPTYSGSSGPNNTAGVQFTNSSLDWVGSGASETDLSFCAVMKIDAFDEFDIAFGAHDGSGSVGQPPGSFTAIIRSFDSNPGFWPAMGVGGVGNSYPLSRFNFSTGDWLVVSGFYSSGDSELFLNGVSSGSLAVDVDEFIINAITIGFYSADGTSVNNPINDMTVSYLSIVDRKVTADERQRWEGYLAHTRGLTASFSVGHPYKTTPPYL